MTMLMPVLTPHGVLTLRRDGEAPEFEPAQDARLEQAFRRGPGHGLLALGASEVATALPAKARRRGTTATKPAPANPKK